MSAERDSGDLRAGFDRGAHLLAALDRLLDHLDSPEARERVRDAVQYEVVAREMRTQPDPRSGANWDDWHVPAPSGHAPRLDWFEYYLDEQVGEQYELRELESGACIVVQNAAGLCPVGEWC